MPIHNLESTILDFIDGAARNAAVRPLNLGGLGGAGGGVGTTPAGFIGRLPQTRVAYDTDEIASSGIPVSGYSLLDNLNHIRFRLQELEALPPGSSITVVDENTASTYNDVTDIKVSGAVTVTDEGGGVISMDFTGGPGGGVEEAPEDSTTYGRNNAAWTILDDEYLRLDGQGTMVGTLWVINATPDEQAAYFSLDGDNISVQADHYGYSNQVITSPTMLVERIVGDNTNVIFSGALIHGIQHANSNGEMIGDLLLFSTYEDLPNFPGGELFRITSSGVAYSQEKLMLTVTHVENETTYFHMNSTEHGYVSSITAFGASLLDDADASTARTTLGLGTLATQDGTFSGNGTYASGGFTGTLTENGTFALLGTANVFTAAQQITVATATNTGLILKTSDNNTTRNLLDVQNSSGAVRLHISSVGNISMRNDSTPTLEGDTSLRITRSWSTTGGATQYASRTIANIANTTGAITADLRSYSIEGTLGNNSNTGGTVYGMKVLMQNNSASGVINEIRGLSIGINATAAGGAITNAYGIRIEDRANTGTLANSYGLYMDNQDNATINYAIYTNAGLNRLGDQLSIVGSADRQQFIATGYSTQAVGTAISQITRADAAAGVSAMLGLTALGSGANGDGGSVLLKGKSSTTAAQDMGLIEWLWVNSTHASRTAKLRLSAYDTAQRTALELYANGSQSMVAVGGATASARLTLPAGGTAASTAPIKFTTQAAGLTSVEQGTMELIGNSLQFTQLLKRRGVSMSQNVRTSSTVVQNSVTESGALLTAEHGANYLEVGKCEELSLLGVIEQRSNPNAYVTIRVKYAGVTIHTVSTPGSTLINSSTPFRLLVATTCRSTGASGTMQINSVFEVGGLSTSGGSSLASIDTTTAQDTTITVQWAEANASDIFTVEQGRVLCIETNK